MSIPLNNIVKINPSVLDVGNNGNNLFGLMLTQKKRNLSSNIVTSFSNADQVGKVFGTNTTEYKLAKIYFGGFTNSDRVAEQLYIAPYYEDDSASSLIGGTLSGMTLDKLKSLSGSMQIAVDGKDYSANDINLSKATSFSDAASILSGKLGVPITYTSSFNSMVITSPTSGNTSSVAFASGNIADSLRLTQEMGAIQSQGASNSSPSSLLNTLRKTNRTFCTVFLTWEATENEKMEFAQWADSMDNDVAVILSDSANNVTVSQTGTSFSEKIQAKDYQGIVPIYNYLELGAFIAGYAAAWDLTKTDGRFTAAFRRSSQLISNVSDEDIALALKANGYNFYGSWASATSNFTFMYEGVVSGIYKWLDSWFCQIWMRRNMQEALMRMLLAKGQIPYNIDGKGIIQTALNPSISQFISFGAIRNGITLSNDQIETLKQAGLSQSQINTIMMTGYYLDVRMDKVTPQTRVKRGSPPIIFWYTDGQSVQQIIMQSVEIQ